MINNNSTERYETEIEDAINALEEERFKEDYNAMYEKYNVEIYEGDWNRVQLGSTVSQKQQYKIRKNLVVFRRAYQEIKQ